MYGRYGFTSEDVSQRENSSSEASHIVLEWVDAQFTILSSVICGNDEVVILSRVGRGYDEVGVVADSIFAYFADDLQPRLLFLHIISIIMEDEMLGMTMHMAVKWKWDISFIFESWTVLNGEVGFIILGLVLTIFTSMLSVALPALKGKVTGKLFRQKYNSTLLTKERDTVISEQDDDTDRPQTTAQHIFGFFYILVYSLLHIATMMLIMTYNGYVIIAVIVGLTLGFALFGFQCDKDKNVPVNCCA